MKKNKWFMLKTEITMNVKVCLTEMRNFQMMLFQFPEN